MSFTIDDGNVTLDIKFIDIVKPHGFLGTFNICHTAYKGYTPDDYYYATNKQVFDYEDAIKSAYVKDGRLYNPSKLDLYAKIDGEMVIIPAGKSVEVN